jgi:hypothetical protein
MARWRACRSTASTTWETRSSSQTTGSTPGSLRLGCCSGLRACGKLTWMTSGATSRTAAQVCGGGRHRWNGAGHATCTPCQLRPLRLRLRLLRTQPTAGHAASVAAVRPAGSICIQLLQLLPLCMPGSIAVPALLSILPVPSRPVTLHHPNVPAPSPSHPASHRGQPARHPGGAGGAARRHPVRLQGDALLHIQGGPHVPHGLRKGGWVGGVCVVVVGGVCVSVCGISKAAVMTHMALCSL